MNPPPSTTEGGFNPLRLEEPFVQQSTTVSRNSKGGSTPSRGTTASPSSGAIANEISRPPHTAVERGCRVATLSLEFGDEYIGETITNGGLAVPHGRGVLKSTSGQHEYDGEFAYQSRDGHGKLTTDRFKLWCKWKMNRPDGATSALLEYADGNKYSGFLSFHQDTSAAQQLSRSTHSRLSKFSIWLQTSTPIREGWGEYVDRSGDRYFGQWANNLPNGFGCYMTLSGDRYVGLLQNGKFHDTGTLFLRSPAIGKAPGALPDGVKFVQTAGSKQGDAGVVEKRTELSTSDYTFGRVSQAVRDGNDCAGSLEALKQRWGGVIYDGVWEAGRFIGEGHVTLPCGSRISAVWKDFRSPTNGRLSVSTSSNPNSQHNKDSNVHMRGWTQCFHWESLLCGICEDLKANRYSACATYRERLKSARTQDEVQSILGDFCDSENTLVNALKVFRRCFFFLHGTCGKGSEVGSGLGSNKLGWCHAGNQLGVCIHHARGRRICVADVDLAMTDVVSFVHSVERWTMEMLGESPMADRDTNLSYMRRILDTVLQDVHDILFNLYAQAYSEEDNILSTVLDRLRERTTLDDLGVNFARQQTAEELFDPYADAIHSIERLARGSRTYTGKLRVLAQWSMEIDLSTRLAQMSVDDGSLLQLSRSGKQLASGSADDLIPIHQYVLMKAKLPHLFAHTTLLADLSSEDMFMEFTSQENFFIITLQACTMLLAKLHPLLRDECMVLAPPHLFEERLRLCAQSIRRLVGLYLEAVSAKPATAADVCCTTEVEGLDRVVLGYLKAWLPEALDSVAAQCYVPADGMEQLIPLADVITTEETRDMALLLERSCPCWVHTCVGWRPRTFYLSCICVLCLLAVVSLTHWWSLSIHLYSSKNTVSGRKCMRELLAFHHLLCS
ncbi:putative protein kinase [Trypanosoma vivax]|nr:putative protein kinase [Trypanosoma vivax]